MNRFTKYDIDRISLLVRHHGSYNKAANAIGVKPVTLRNRKKGDKVTVRVLGVIRQGANAIRNAGGPSADPKIRDKALDPKIKDIRRVPDHVSAPEPHALAGREGDSAGTATRTITDSALASGVTVSQGSETNVVYGNSPLDLAAGRLSRIKTILSQCDLTRQLSLVIRELQDLDAVEAVPDVYAEIAEAAQEFLTERNSPDLVTITALLNVAAVDVSRAATAPTPDKTTVRATALQAAALAVLALEAVGAPS